MEVSIVTGGRGFIGTNLCNHLVKYGVHVVAIDNMLCPSEMPLDSRVDFIKYDITDCECDINIPKWVDSVGKIYHLASLASPVWYKRYPMETMKTNILGTENMCKVAINMDAKLLLTSTSEVYGNPLEHPQSESYNGNVSTLTDRASYDESKRCAETVVYEQMKKGLNATIVRIFNTYGPGMRSDDGRVVSEFIMRGLNNKSLKVYNGGLQTRSFCYIDDMIQYLIRAMSCSHPGPINIGNRDERQIMELVFLIQDILYKDLNVSYHIVDDGDPVKRRPDLSLAKSELGYVPEIDIYEGLTRTVEYFKNINE